MSPVTRPLETKDPSLRGGHVDGAGRFRCRDTVSGTEGGNLETFRVGQVGIVLARRTGSDFIRDRQGRDASRVEPQISSDAGFN